MFISGWDPRIKYANGRPQFLSLEIPGTVVIKKEGKYKKKVNLLYSRVLKWIKRYFFSFFSQHEFCY